MKLFVSVLIHAQVELIEQPEGFATVGPPPISFSQATDEKGQPLQPEQRQLAAIAMLHAVAHVHNELNAAGFLDQKPVRLKSEGAN